MTTTVRLASVALAIVAVMVSPSAGAAATTFAQVQSMEKAGRWTAALQEYEKIWADKKSKSEDVRKAKQAFEALNFRFLMSRGKSPGSVMHKVREGDSLSALANQHGTTVILIRKLNGLKDDTIKPGMVLKIISAKVTIHVDKSENVLRLRLDGKPLRTYRVSTGLQGGTPEGEFRIINKLRNPTWYRTGAVFPPGDPKNSLGSRWLGFDYPGYGIHGTIEPHLIGKSVSSGCVRLKNKEVEELYDIVPLGTRVTIAE